MNVILAEGQGLAVGNTDHPFHQIQPGDFFGHRMFDLKTGVHLKEIKISILINDKFDGAGGGIPHRLGEGDGLGAHGAAGIRIQERRWRFFDDFLMTALDRTFTLSQVNGVARRIGQYLNFNMAGVFDVFFDKHAAVAERGFGFAAGAFQAVAAFFVVSGNPHAFAAAAGSCLQHHRIADGVGRLNRFGGIFHRPAVSRHRINAGLERHLFRLDLIAHDRDRLRLRPDKGDSCFLQGLGKSGIFRQKPVSGMNGVGTGIRNRFHNVVDVEIAFRSSRRADQDTVVGHFHMQGPGIGLGANGNSLNPHFPGRSDDPAGDFPPVGDENFLEHAPWRPRRSLPGTLAARFGRTEKSLK